MRNKNEPDQVKEVNTSNIVNPPNTQLQLTTTWNLIDLWATKDFIPLPLNWIQSKNKNFDLI